MRIEYKTENAFECAIVDSGRYERECGLEEGKLSEVRKNKDLLHAGVALLDKQRLLDCGHHPLSARA